MEWSSLPPKVSTTTTVAATDGDWGLWRQAVSQLGTQTGHT